MPTKEEKVIYTICMLLLVISLFSIAFLTSNTTGVTGNVILQDPEMTEWNEESLGTLIGADAQEKTFLDKYMIYILLIIIAIITIAVALSKKVKEHFRKADVDDMKIELKNLNKLINKTKQEINDKTISTEEGGKKIGKYKTRKIEIKHAVPFSESIIYGHSSKKLIPIESFTRFRRFDLLAILILALTAGVLSLITNNTMEPQYAFIVSLLIITTFMSFTVYLVRRAGTAILFFAIVALLSYPITNLGISIANKVLVLIITGVLFELFFLLFTHVVRHTQINIILSTAISTASIPITTLILMSYHIPVDIIPIVLNLVLIAFFVGIAGSVISFLIWYHLKETKQVLKFEYAM